MPLLPLVRIHPPYTLLGADVYVLWTGPQSLETHATCYILVVVLTLEAGQYDIIVKDTPQSLSPCDLVKATCPVSAWPSLALECDAGGVSLTEK